ncbi:hypothetical protein J6S37_03170 [Candidatus Saccharibacteria bacterium]|nr:hypothetical protein [Candidatus Saccharibacteria bacterium]
MKNDLITSIALAVVGILIAYFVTNLLIDQMMPLASFPVKTITSSVDTNLVDPDPEVFNYKAIDPTVEVYVGDCTEYNERGECIEQTNGSNQGSE